ncbi:zinc metalloprotease HtpX [Kribbella sancticallisti]|uniref:Zinc metalloprotease HtpX n=1 Tax=Kribbella sancticallisti TaxID=460087 RepID=A0ABN2ECG4_9ACTN
MDEAADADADAAAGRLRRLKAGMRRAFTRPPGYRNVFVWFVTGMLRNKRGLVGALIATWFNLPIAVLLGGLGLVIGAIAGYVGGALGGNNTADSWLSDIPVLSSMLNSAMLQGGGILGLLAGAAVGALGGFLFGLLVPWLAVAAISPFDGIGRFLAQLLVALLCGLLYTIYGVMAEGWLLRVQGARRPSRREQALIDPIIKDCAKRMGLSSVPPLLIDDDRAPNAFAATRHIAVNRGFLDEFDYDPEPLAGVICHELTHWRNADTISNLFIRGVALPLYLSYNVCTWLLQITRGTAQFIVMLTTWPILVCIRYFVMPLQAAGSQAAEYQADQGAVYAGHRQGIRQVLTRFRDSFDGARNGWDLSILASHPPNELRLEAIEESGVDYPLPDADGPATPMPVIITSSLVRD